MKSKPIIVESAPATIYRSEDGRRSFGKLTAYRRTARHRIRQMRPCEGHEDDVGGGISYLFYKCDGRCFWNNEDYHRVVNRYARMLVIKNEQISKDQKDIKNLLKIQDDKFFIRKKG